MGRDIEIDDEAPETRRRVWLAPGEDGNEDATALHVIPLEPFRKTLQSLRQDGHLDDGDVIRDYVRYIGTSDATRAPLPEQPPYVEPEVEVEARPPAVRLLSRPSLPPLSPRPARPSRPSLTPAEAAELLPPDLLADVEEELGGRR